MATAVLDIELDQHPETIRVPEHYTSAFILLRYKHKPVGSIKIPLYGGELRLADHADNITDACVDRLCQERVNEFLGKDFVESGKRPLKKATIAICTRNRTADLRRCLESLQQLPDLGQEVLVVDNCPSNEDTFAMVTAMANVRYVREDRPGLNIARNRALREARHEIVAFIDDDAIADPIWLENILVPFERDRVVCVTGMTMPLELETEAQEAFERYSPFGKGFSGKLYDTLHDPLSTGQVGAGANMALRKSVLELAGGFDEALDAGTPTQSGGDHEYFTRILRRGYYIAYEPSALNWHRHRKTWEETRRAIEGYGTGVYAYWTKLFWYDGEWGILRYPFGWFFHVQFPSFLRSLFKRPGHQPMRLVLAEMRGCWKGPWMYFRSRRNLPNKSSAT